MPVRPILDAGGIREAVAAMARAIERDHPDGVVLVGVLKGGLLLLADLARAIQAVPVEIEFIAISRYQSGGGRVAIVLDLATDIRDRSVVIVDDIVDTGLTLAYLSAQLRARGPRALSVCVLVDRSDRRLVPEPVHYRGVIVSEDYLLGYGLHHHELYRNVGQVVAADPEALAADPRAHLAELYPRPG